MAAPAPPAAPAEYTFSIEDVFGLIDRALMPFYSDQNVKVNISHENDNNNGNNNNGNNNNGNNNNGNNNEVQTNVPELSFIMRAIGSEMADRWADKEKVLEGMHKVLNDDYYDDFTFDLDAFVAKISYGFGGGSRRKSSRKSRKTRKLRR
jgi:hypothetical protein